MENEKELAFILGFLGLAMVGSGAMISLDNGYFGWFILLTLIAIIDSWGIVINIEEYVEKK